MPASDPFPGYEKAPDGPYDDGFAITPNDSTELATIPSALYVGGAGALVVTTMKGTDLTFAAVPAGTTIRLRVRKVKATGTVATSIVGLF